MPQRRFESSTLAVALLFLLFLSPSSTHAATGGGGASSSKAPRAFSKHIWTPAQFIVEADSMACGITNVGSKTQEIRFRAISGTNETLADSGFVQAVPFHTVDIHTNGTNGFIFCEFCFDGKSENFRASSLTFKWGTSDLVVVPAY